MRGWYTQLAPRNDPATRKMMYEGLETVISHAAREAKLDLVPSFASYPKHAIGIVVAQRFSDPELIRTTLEQGIERVSPETVWVMRDQIRKGHASEFAWQTFKNHNIVPFLAPLVPVWDLRPHGQDIRADWRDIEMRATCDRIIVFHDKSSNVTAKWKEYKTNGLSAATIYVVERGKVKAKRYRKGRTPN